MHKITVAGVTAPCLFCARLDMINKPICDRSGNLFLIVRGI